MNTLTTGSVAITLAAALAAGHAEPVYAGLSKQQVRALIRQEARAMVRQEIAKIPKPKGLFLFAHVLPTPDPEREPIVVEANSSGITQANIRFEEFVDPLLPDRIVASYCFTGLPPVRGGQVTTNVGDTFDPGFLELNPAAESCPVRVIVNHGPEVIPGSEFFVLLYR